MRVPSPLLLVCHVACFGFVFEVLQLIFRQGGKKPIKASHFKTLKFTFSDKHAIDRKASEYACKNIRCCLHNFKTFRNTIRTSFVAKCGNGNNVTNTSSQLPMQYYDFDVSKLNCSGSNLSHNSMSFFNYPSESMY